MTHPLHFLIVGAGGIGAYYGARLQRAGHQVSFVARGEHLRAMRERGLRVSHPKFSFDEAVNAVSMEELQAQHRADEFSHLLLATKAGVTAEIMQQLAGWLSHAQLPVLSLQNGVDNEARIAATLGEERTIGGLAVRIGGHVTAPGRVEATGVAQVIIGAWPNAEKNPLQAELDPLVAALCDAGIPTQLSDDIQRELWKKLLINNGVNPLSALTTMDTRSLTHHPVLGGSVYQLMREAATAARADGVDIGQPEVDAMYDLIRDFDAIKTSMLVDLEKGRALELEEIAGAVIGRCGRIGEAAPVTALVKGLLELKLAAY